MNPTPTDVTLSIRYLRESAGLTQGELAQKLGVSRITILRWETGENEPRSRHIRDLARILDVPVPLILDALQGMAA